MRFGSLRRLGVAGLASTLRSSAALVGPRFGRRPCSVADSLDGGQRVRFGFPAELRARTSFTRSGSRCPRRGSWPSTLSSMNWGLWSIGQRIDAAAPALVSSAIGARTCAGLRSGWSALSAFFSSRRVTGLLGCSVAARRFLRFRRCRRDPERVGRLPRLAGCGAAGRCGGRAADRRFGRFTPSRGSAGGEP